MYKSEFIISKTIATLNITEYDEVEADISLGTR